MFVHLVSFIVIVYFVFEIVKPVNVLNNCSDDNCVCEPFYTLGYKFTVRYFVNIFLLLF